MRVVKVVLINYLSLFFLLTCSCLEGIAQASAEYLLNVRQLNIQDGLSHRIVNSICQDKKGYIWIGTDNGIDCYDGFEFRSWTKAKSGFPFRQVHHIFEDDAGWFWLFNNKNYSRDDQLNGIYLFHPYSFQHGTISQILQTELPFDMAEVKDYFSSPDGKLLFTTADASWEYQSAKGFTRLNVPSGFIPRTYAADQRIYGTWGDSLVHYHIDEGVTVLRDSGFQYRGMSYLDQDRLLTYETISVSEEANSLAILSTQFPYSSQRLIAPFFYRKKSTQLNYHPFKKQIWIANEKVINVLDKEGRLIYDSSEKMPAQFFDRENRAQFIDKNGTIWFGTSNGIYLVALKQNPFRRLIYSPLDRQVKRQLVACRGMIRVGQNLFVASRHGKQKVDLATGEVTLLDNHLYREPEVARQPFPLTPSRRGHIWTATEHLIVQRASDGREMERYEDAVPTRRIWSIYEDQEEVIWLGCSEAGLYSLDLKSGDRQPSVFPTNSPHLSRSTILHLLEDQAGFIWASSDDGLFKIDRKEKTATRYCSEETGKYHLPAEKFQHVFIDSEGVFWLATASNGLIQWAPDQGILNQFTQKDGLSNNNIYAVYPDQQGHLWLSSDFGIMRFDKQTHEVRTYLEEDGISHYEFNRISHYQDDDGIIYFGSLNGVTVIDPVKLNQLDLTDKRGGISVTYMGITESGNPSYKEVDQEVISGQSMEFSHKVRNMMLRFKSEDYLLADRLRFSYQLEGLNEDWIALNENELKIHELRIGEYRLKVKAQRPDGTFFSAPFILDFEIERPLTHTFWFWALVCALLAFLIWQVIEWRISHLKKRKVELEKLVLARTEEIRQQTEEVKRDKQTIEEQASELKELNKAKSRFFANISHELRTPLSLILGPLDRLLRRNSMENEDRHHLQLMRQHGQQLINRIDEFLDLARMEANQIEYKESAVALYTLLKELIESFRPFALQKNIQLSFLFQADTQLCILIDPEKIRRIIGNFISNAIRYVDEGGIVEVNLSDAGNQLRLDVRDNGPGIHAEDLPYIFDRFYQAQHPEGKPLGGTGIGLALSKELAEVIGGVIEVESEFKKGSCFSLSFPKKEVISESIISPIVLPDPPILIQEKPSTNPLPKKATLLIVEDHRGLQEFLRTELAEYELILVSDGVAAIEHLDAIQQQAVTVASQNTLLQLPDLIISDIMMPRMDGFELLQQLKTTEAWQQIPVIMLTARTGESDKLQALRIGVDDYMVKPFDPEELIQRINLLLERVQQRSKSTTEVPVLEGIPLPERVEHQQWLQKVEQLVLKQLNLSDFTLDTLAADLFISKRQLQRKLKAYTGMTANHYIREIRLHQARLFIENEEVETLSELSYAVGFTDPHYFSTLYQKRYGKKPMELIR